MLERADETMRRRYYECAHPVASCVVCRLRMSMEIPSGAVAALELTVHALYPRKGRLCESWIFSDRAARTYLGGPFYQVRIGRSWVTR